MNFNYLYIVSKATEVSALLTTDESLTMTASHKRRLTHLNIHLSQREVNTFVHQLRIKSLRSLSVHWHTKGRQAVTSIPATDEEKWLKSCWCVFVSVWYLWANKKMTIKTRLSGTCTTTSVYLRPSSGCLIHWGGSSHYGCLLCDRYLFPPHTNPAACSELSLSSCALLTFCWNKSISNANP